jgi:hypothetical protein
MVRKAELSRTKIECAVRGVVREDKDRNNIGKTTIEVDKDSGMIRHHK